MNMPQAGLCDMKLLLVENRNHVWRDLSRLVDIECKYLSEFDSGFFQAEVAHLEEIVGGEQEPWSLQVS